MLISIYQGKSYLTFELLAIEGQNGSVYALLIPPHFVFFFSGSHPQLQSNLSPRMVKNHDDIKAPLFLERGCNVGLGLQSGQQLLEVLPSFRYL